VGSHKDNGGNSNGGGRMQQSIKRGSGIKMAAATVTGSGNNCNNGNEGSGDDSERAGWEVKAMRGGSIGDGHGDGNGNGKGNGNDNGNWDVDATAMATSTATVTVRATAGLVQANVGHKVTLITLSKG
jgi:hypothetical protein